MNSSDFVNLHLHTEYSLLDGACRIKPLMERIRELGQTAVAITDHGNMYGAVEFWNEAKKAGIKPIIGCEVYVARRTRHDREHILDSSPYHLILLCENNEGYRNLVKLVSLASIEGFYNRPRVDVELLQKYHSGLICLSACLAGEIPRILLNDTYEAAKEKALEYLHIFGEGNYFIEVQNHGIKDELNILPNLYRLSAETGIPLAATNDCHYINKEDAEMQNVLMCIQTGKILGDPTGMSFETDEFYVKSADEMAELFHGHEEAVTNTVRIAERCNVEFEFGNIKLPKFTVEGVSDNEEYFRSLCRKGMIAPVERVPLTIIAIGGTCGAQTAGIEQTSGESVDEFCFIRRENGWTVITVFAHPGHVDTPKAALPDIQPGIGKNIQFKSSSGLYFDNLSSFCFPLAKCNPAERHQLGRIADIALFLQFFQIQARHLFFFCFMITLL